MPSNTAARLLSSALVLAVASPAAARPVADDTPPPAVVNALLECRKLEDGAARLACFDRAAAELGKATETHELVVLDRAAVNHTKRSLFGLNLPAIRIFGSNDEELTQIESTIARAYSNRTGPVYVLADGSRWQQIDGPDPLADPGDPVVIHKGAMGSYLARVGKTPGLRVVRLPE
jgi:hypothetical protein